jgi:hypothetical protein
LINEFRNARVARRETRRRQTLLGVPGWCPDFIRFDGRELHLRGWALQGLSRSFRGGFTVNGTPIEPMEWGRPRPDIENLFGYWPGAATSGFDGKLAISATDFFARGYAEIQYVNAATGRPVSPDHSYFLPDPAGQTFPLPDHARQARVQGVGDDDVFVVEGFSAFEKLCRALEKARGTERSGFGQVLDWGSGCGRLSRHLLAVPGIHVTGIDIDAGNVAWCQENLGRGRFFHTPFVPPCVELQDSSFDTVIGMSVMTHLSEPDQFRWLDELARVMKPGAFGSLTVHGNATVARALFSDEMMAKLTTHGFLDGGKNPDLEGAIPDPEFYRNTFHTEPYIREYWKPHFEIVDYRRSVLGNHHDLVIIKRRS